MEVITETPSLIYKKDKNFYLFVSFESALPRLSLEKQPIPSIFRLKGLLVDCFLQIIDEFDFKITTTGMKHDIDYLLSQTSYGSFCEVKPSAFSGGTKTELCEIGRFYSRHHVYERFDHYIYNTLSNISYPIKYDRLVLCVPDLQYYRLILSRCLKSSGIGFSLEWIKNCNGVSVTKDILEVFTRW